MEMKGERLLPAPRPTVWSLLNDPEVLRQCVPGCESMVPSGEHAYEVAMTAAIGPVKARFKGKLSLADIEAPVRYRLLFEGQSSQAGFARGEARIELQQLSPRETRLAYSSKSQVGGRLAQIGSRLIDAAAVAITEKFFAAFAAQLTERTGAVPGAPAAVSGAATSARGGVLGWLGRFLLRHLFARRS